MQIDRIDYLKFRKEDIDNIIKMIEQDTQLMCDFNIMDYSLLMAIEKVPRALRKRTSFLMSDKFYDNMSYMESENVCRNSFDDSK